jgi:transcriptional regulator with XRE-family HTH domain
MAKAQILELELSRLDWFIINRVKELRHKKGISQGQLSVEMGFSDKFVGGIENPTSSTKYNIRHLNLLAVALNCTLSDLLPEKPFEDDIIRVRIKKTPKLDKNGKATSKSQFEVLDIRAVKNGK